MKHEETTGAVAPPFERGVGRLAPERDHADAPHTGNWMLPQEAERLAHLWCAGQPLDDLPQWRTAMQVLVRELHCARQTLPMGEGELWSWVRSVMCQGADIRVDYDMGNHKGYEAYSARLDAAAAERAQELAARLKTPNEKGNRPA